MRPIEYGIAHLVFGCLDFVRHPFKADRKKIFFSKGTICPCGGRDFSFEIYVSKRCTSIKFPAAMKFFNSTSAERNHRFKGLICLVEYKFGYKCCTNRNPLVLMGLGKLKGMVESDQSKWKNYI